MKAAIQFIVPGKPAPRGSKRGFPIKRKDGSVGVALADMSKNGKLWMNAVKFSAAEVWTQPPLDCPVMLSVFFHFERPKSHYGTGRNAARVKASAPGIYHSQRPDLAKLLRGLEDALTGVIWKDDSLVAVYGSVQKRWTGEQSHTVIKIEMLNTKGKHER